METKGIQDFKEDDVSNAIPWNSLQCDKDSNYPWSLAQGDFSDSTENILSTESYRTCSSGELGSEDKVCSSQRLRNLSGKIMKQIISNGLMFSRYENEQADDALKQSFKV